MAVLTRRRDLSGPLSSDQFDANIDNLDDRVTDLEDNPPTAVSIDSINTVEDQMTITLTDLSTQGPFTLPTARWNDRGTWAALTPYAVNDTFGINGTFYLVIFAHTSGASFDAGANDGMGHDYYHAIFTEPGNSLPDGGLTGQNLRKASDTDYDTEWGFDDASETTFTPSSDSDLSSDNVADALEELETLIATEVGAVDAADVSFEASSDSDLVSTNVADALEELEGMIGGGAVDAADVTFEAPSDSSLVSTNVADALVELETDIDGKLALADVVGKQTLWIPASAMLSRVTNGPALGTVETSSNKNMIRTLDYDTTTQEFAQVDIPLPKSWNNGTVTFAFYWSHAATVTNFGVAFGVDAIAISDNETLDVSFGTAGVVTDTGGTTDKLYVSSESSAITIAGTPATGDLVQFRIHRDPANGSDNLAVDARLHGIKLYYTTSATTDA